MWDWWPISKLGYSSPPKRVRKVRHEEVRALNVGAPPHNQRIEPTAGGRRGLCRSSLWEPFSGAKDHAGSLRGFCFAGAAPAVLAAHPRVT